MYLTYVRGRWSERDIKVGDVLVSVDGKEPSSLYEALSVSTHHAIPHPYRTVLTVALRGVNVA